ncbi:hypothetical protein FHL15_006854 [Xylaria flabelliformis]|uniref:Uncharacterized protein n=1 Tax=Xylaria flabelliformis TaxID=2512241 RepID=A0A553HWA6_9PEZI|nr:hypothetical protein FHL15_006854 [Xylaria flabelliformis]
MPPGKLREISPKSGSKLWQSLLFHLTLPNKMTVNYLGKKRVMSRSYRDKQVCDALKAAGYDLSTAGLRQAFTPMFQIATPVFIDARAKHRDLWDMLATVQQQLDWARLLGFSVFFELFTRLIESRYRWEKRPVYPFFDYHLYNPIVVELVKFRKAVGDCPQEDSLDVPDYTSWILTDAEFYNELAGGLDEEDGGTGMIQPDERDDLIPPMQMMAIEKDDLVPSMENMTIEKREDHLVAMQLDD